MSLSLVLRANWFIALDRVLILDSLSLSFCLSYQFYLCICVAFFLLPLYHLLTCLSPSLFSYGGPQPADELAAKAAGRELNGACWIAAVSGAAKDRVRVPLMCLIDYRVRAEANGPSDIYTREREKRRGENMYTESLFSISIIIALSLHSPVSVHSLGLPSDCLVYASHWQGHAALRVAGRRPDSEGR